MSAAFTAEQAREQYAGEVKRARELKAAADKKRDAMKAEGLNLLADENKDKFDELDAEYLAADQAADNAEVLRGRMERFIQMDSSRPSTEDRKPYGGEPNGNGAWNARPKSIAHRVTDDATFKAWHERFNRELAAGEGAAAAFLQSNGFGRMPILSASEFRSLMEYQATTITGGGATSAAPFIVNDLQPGFVPYARKNPTIASLVGQGETNSDIVEYVHQTAVSTQAAETGEDIAAPEAAITWENLTANVREITDFIPITLRAMADAGQLRSVVENDLIAGVLDILDTELYAGPGTGVTLTGITLTSGINTQPLGGDTRLDCLHKCVTQIRVAAGVLSEADAMVMNGNDWQKVRLEKDADGQYLLGPAGMSGEKQIWGVPVVISNVATTGAPLVGDFARSARMWTREGIHLNAGLDGNDFTKRRISLLAAIRVAFAVTRPTGFVLVSGF